MQKDKTVHACVCVCVCVCVCDFRFSKEGSTPEFDTMYIANNCTILLRSYQNSVANNNQCS